ncbi:MAG: DUF4229 domain-containing protein [Actinomycetales bacterium]|nr:DUF4229 domain-containing protein [Actinomycetales bacterium]
MKPALIYSLSRAGLLVVCLGLGYLVNLRGITLLLVGFLGSGILSFLLLAKQRAAMGQRLSQSVAKVSERIDKNTRKEDID